MTRISGTGPARGLGASTPPSAASGAPAASAVPELSSRSDFDAVPPSSTALVAPAGDCSETVDGHLPSEDASGAVRWDSTSRPAGRSGLRSWDITRDGAIRAKDGQRVTVPTVAELHAQVTRRFRILAENELPATEQALREVVGRVEVGFRSMHEDAEGLPLAVHLVDSSAGEANAFVALARDPKTNALQAEIFVSAGP